MEVNRASLIKFLIGAGAACLVAVIGGRMVGDVVHQYSSYISMNGVADRQIVADRAVWTITITTEGGTVKDAREKMKKAKPTVLGFLKTEGFSIDDIEYESDVNDLSWRSQSDELIKSSRFSISDKLILSTTDFERLKKSNLKLLELMENGFSVTTSIEYFCENIDKLRVEMIEAATKDAAHRANKVAESLGVKISGVRHIESGRISISPVDSTITSSDYEWRETRSINKRLRVVVRASFNLER